MAITEEGLSNFYNGTNTVWHHPMYKKVTYTDGVRYLMHNGAAWFVEGIFAHIYFTVKFKKHLEFFVITLKKNDDNTATIAYDDGNGKVFHTDKIDFTDFPLKEISLYFENGMVLLPSER
jgi:hypothetical protein